MEPGKKIYFGLLYSVMREKMNKAIFVLIGKLASLSTPKEMII